MEVSTNLETVEVTRIAVFLTAFYRQQKIEAAKGKGVDWRKQQWLVYFRRVRGADLYNECLRNARRG